VSSLLESIEKEVKRKAYETMIDCLESYQGQVEEAIEEFQHGTRAFH
jgi:exonuclease VII small subunit